MPLHTLPPRHSAFRRPAPLRRSALALASLLALAVHAQQPTPAPAAAAAPTVVLDLPAAPLDQALNALAQRTGVQVVLASSLAAGRTAPAVRGSFTPQRALEQLLAGTGLAARVADGGKTFVVEPAPAAPARAPAASLGEVQVTAQTDREGPTEGNGSYTTPITRTATGLTLSPRDTPQSISVVTRERMDEQAMATVADALRNTAGVSVNALDRGRNNLSVRGFTVSKFQFDGIPVDTGNIGIETANTVLYDRVDVLRGATGLLTGTGDASATINLVRKRAASKAFTGSAAVQVGSWGQRSGTVDLSTPLNADASVRARLVAHANDQDAFIDWEHTRNTTLYGTVEADLGPRTRLNVGLSEQRDKRDGLTWVGMPYWFSDGRRTNWDRSKSIATHWNFWNTTEQTAFATLQHRFDNRWVVNAVLDYHRQEEESKLLWNTGSTVHPVTGLGQTGRPYHYLTLPTQRTAGITATGPFSLLRRAHEATFGLTHSRSDSAWSNRAVLSGQSQAMPSLITWDGHFPEQAMGERVWGQGTHTTQTGVYGAARLQVADPLKLILGGRATYWRRDLTGGGVPEVHLRESGVFTPYAGLVFDLNEHTSAYASYTDVFKPQTQRDRSGSYLDPLKGKNYELGLKGEFMDGQLNASAALFQVRQDNFAVRDGDFFVPGTTTAAYYAAKGVTAKGYEMEIAGRIAPGWNLSASWTHYSARDAARANVALDHPRKLLRLFSSYTLPGAWNKITLGAGVNWQSTLLTTAVNPGTGLRERVGQPAYALVNLMARYAISEQFALQLNVSNALDKKYYSSASVSGGYLWGEPRRVTAALNYKF